MVRSQKAFLTSGVKPCAVGQEKSSISCINGCGNLWNIGLVSVELSLLWNGGRGVDRDQQINDVFTNGIQDGSGEEFQAAE